jgi:hypothetical protein
MHQPTDAARVMQENLDKMRAEAAERAKVEQAAEERRLAREQAYKEEARQQEDALVQRVEDIATREALLEHIRRMRAGPPAPPAPPPLTEAARKRLEEEQEAGRRAAAAFQTGRAQEAGIEKREAEKLGRMEEVVHPNPTQQQQFPATGTTRGKRKG